MQQSKLAQYKAYSQATQTVAKTRQIVMLYDGAIRFIKQAKEAIKENRIEDRYNLLIKASNIVLGLQGCIDFEKGGQVAQMLYDFYSAVDAKLLVIHRNNNLESCDQLITELKDMRDAWSDIDRSLGNAVPTATATTTTSSLPAEAEKIPQSGPTTDPDAGSVRVSA